MTASRLNEEVENITAKTLDVVGITREEYNELFFELSCLYTERVCKVDKMALALQLSEEFWAWMSLVFKEIQSSFIERIHYIDGCPAFKKTLINNKNVTIYSFAKKEALRREYSRYIGFMLSSIEIDKSLIKLIENGAKDENV